jgi:hypothetical protein
VQRSDEAQKAATTTAHPSARCRQFRNLYRLGAADGRVLTVGDQDDPNVINVASDEPFVRSLVRIGFASLPPEPTLDASPGRR